MRATPTLFRRAASLSAFWASAPQAEISKSKAGNNKKVVRALNEQFKMVASCGEVRFAMEECRPLDRQEHIREAHAAAPIIVHGYASSALGYRARNVLACRRSSRRTFVSRSRSSGVGARR